MKQKETGEGDEGGYALHLHFGLPEFDVVGRKLGIWIGLEWGQKHSHTSWDEVGWVTGS